MGILIVSLLAVCALCVVLAVREQNKKAEADAEYLRHAINVNVSLLQAEISTLTAIADAQPSSADRDRAKELIEEARLVADAATAFQDSQALCDRLADVFAAMSQTSEARHLLKACDPNFLAG